MKYTKQNIQKKRQILSSEKIRRNSKISLFLFKYAFIISIALIVTGLGLGVGFVRGILKTTPQITCGIVHICIIFQIPQNRKQRLYDIPCR